MKERTDLERRLLDRVTELTAEIAEVVNERNELRRQLDSKEYEAEIKTRDYDVIAQCLSDYQIFGWTDRLAVALELSR